MKITEKFLNKILVDSEVISQKDFNLAKKEADVLVVTITKDKYVRRGPGRPIFNEHLRAETLASLAITDYVCIIDSPTATMY